MSKPSIQNITTIQTFQNWLDKTNEIVDIMRDSALTASVSGDITSGDATLVGKFTANTVVVFDELKTNNIVSRTSGEPVLFGNQVRVVATGQDALAAVFEYGASGARTRYTDGNSAWDVGYDNKIDQNFLINHVGSGIQFKLAPSGVLTVPSLITSTDMIVGTNLTVEENLTANTATFVSANGSFNGTFAGNFTGDIFHPAGNKILENGGPAANIPAVFTGNVTGNATTATRLQTARTIGGVSFNGTANINLPGVNTAGNQNTTGNAATATNAIDIANGAAGSPLIVPRIVGKAAKRFADYPVIPVFAANTHSAEIGNNLQSFATQTTSTSEVLAFRYTIDKYIGVLRFRTGQGGGSYTITSETYGGGDITSTLNTTSTLRIFKNGSLIATYTATGPGSINRTNDIPVSPGDVIEWRHRTSRPGFFGQLGFATISGTTVLGSNGYIARELFLQATEVNNV